MDDDLMTNRELIDISNVSHIWVWPMGYPISYDIVLTVNMTEIYVCRPIGYFLNIYKLKLNNIDHIMLTS